MVAFINTFLSYLLVFAVFIILVCLAVFLGIKLRKNKDKKEQKITDNTKDTITDK